MERMYHTYDKPTAAVLFDNTASVRIAYIRLLGRNTSLGEGKAEAC